MESARLSNEGARKQLEGPVAFYRGVCSANLGKSDRAVEQFGAFLKLQPGATIDGAAYSKKTVAAFEKAQKAAADRSPSLAEAYKESQVPADMKDRYPSDQFWADGAVRWIMTADEKARWTSLTDPNARVAFVEEFWTARASLPGADGRTYRQEFERRVAFADANLAQDEEQRGSMTDRGMVFLLMGPPTYAGRRPLRAGDDAGVSDGLSRINSQDAETWQKGMSGRRDVTSGAIAIQSTKFSGSEKTALESNKDRVEVWHYRKELLPKKVPYQQVDFQFLTKKGYGVNVLQRESDTVGTLRAARPGSASP